MRKILFVKKLIYLLKNYLLKQINTLTWHKTTKLKKKTEKFWQAVAWYTKTRLWKLTDNVWWKYSETEHCQNSRNSLRSKFFPVARNGFIPSRNCGKEKRSSFWPAPLFVALNLFRSSTHFHRYREHGVNYLSCFAIRISIKSRLFHIFISCISIGSSMYCISNGTAISTKSS